MPFTPKLNDQPPRDRRHHSSPDEHRTADVHAGFSPDHPRFLPLDDRGFSFGSSTQAQNLNHLRLSDSRTTSHSRSPVQSRSASARPETPPHATVASPFARDSAESSHPREHARRLTSDFSQPTAEEDASEHVRAVYAHLDQVGVPGDGFVEGIERTRERRGRDGREGSPEVDMEKQRVALSLLTNEDGLAVREEEVLARTDRFGFFEESHKNVGGGMARTTLLPRLGLETLPSRSLPVRPSKRKLAPWGPPTSDPPMSPTLIETRAFSAIKGERSAGAAELAVPSTSQPTSAAKEVERVRKWSDMLQVSSRDEGGNIAGYELAPAFRAGRGRRRFEKRCYKGIPDRWRRAVWDVLMRGFGTEWGTPWDVSPDRAMEDREAMGRKYSEAVETPSPQDVQIDLDVPRTISGNVYFHTRYGKGQRALFHVLHAWGLYCSECGYCQGMGSIAATFLSYYEAESAYSSLLLLHDRYSLHRIFQPGFPGLVECFYLQERLIETLMPDVHRVFKDQMISSSAYATKWYITLFATTIPFRSQLRLWDAFLLEGKDVLVFAAVSLVWAFRKRLCSTAASFETILSLLSCFFLIEDDDVWTRWIGKLARRSQVRAMMKQWRREWRGFVEDGTAASRMT